MFAKARWHPTGGRWRKGFLAAWLLLAALPWPAKAHDVLGTTPSVTLVTDLFDAVVDAAFSMPGPADHETLPRITAIRRHLAAAIDAEGIAAFILGRYNRHTSEAPADGLLDFAATSLAKMGAAEAKSAPGRHGRPLPVLTILDLTIRQDQTRLVTSELRLAKGQTLPLIWEIRPSPDGLKIEDVHCFGISLRLMLRSAVASAAAERPGDAANLRQLLGAAGPIGSLNGGKITP